MNAAVRLTRVSKSFGGHTAVRELDLVVPEGSMYGFIGPNGSGKTTTLRMILHILQPDTGEVEVLGKVGARAANDGVGYLPEERGLYKKMTVRRLLTYYAALKGMPSRPARLEMERWLELFGLTEWRDKKIEALSKGMAQKIQFISTVLSKPRLVILDEPFSGLDPVNLEVMRTAIMELARGGSSVIFSTHDMTVAEQLCSSVFMIFKGNKVLDGTMDEVRSRYGQDTLRVRTDGGMEALRDLPMAESVRDLGAYQEVRLAGDSQEFLRALSARTSIRHFEETNPSLQDIFIRIAGPEAEQATQAVEVAQ